MISSELAAFIDGRLKEEAVAGRLRGAVARVLSECSARGERVSLTTVRRRADAMRGKVAVRPVVPCTSCGAPTSGAGLTGLCQSCASRANAERRSAPDTVWIQLPNGRRRRAADCHPDKIAVSRGRCDACTQKARAAAGLRWRSDEYYRKQAERQAAKRDEKRGGKAQKPWKRRESRPCARSGCEGTTKLKYCSRECASTATPPKPCTPCRACGAPSPRGRVTCSTACVAALLPASGQRSESVRARRRRDKAAKYRRADKAEVIAKLTAEQGGLCASCGTDGAPRGLVLDHCHATGNPRAMLCASCNIAFGHLRESPDRIRGLLAYAERWHAASSPDARRRAA